MESTIWYCTWLSELKKVLSLGTLRLLGTKENSDSSHVLPSRVKWSVPVSTSSVSLHLPAIFSSATDSCHHQLPLLGYAMNIHNSWIFTFYICRFTPDYSQVEENFEVISRIILFSWIYAHYSHNADRTEGPSFFESAYIASKLKNQKPTIGSRHQVSS